MPLPSKFSHEFVVAVALSVTVLVSGCGGGGGDVPASANVLTVAAAASASDGTAAPSVAPVLAAEATLAPVINANKLPLGVAGASTDQVAPTNDPPVPSDIGSFRTVCDFSHMAFDDPIVYPGQPGKSHLHAFFGNTGTNAYSTNASLASTGNGTCRGGTINRTGYWVPAMIDTKDGTPLPPRTLVVYYKTGYNGVVPASVHAMPVGLRMISGDSSAKAPYWASPQFRCQGGTRDVPWSQSIPDCLAGEELWQVIGFPQCWDGVNLDSPDHKSHMHEAWAGNGVWDGYPKTITKGCPDTHPVALPEVTLSVIYPVTTDHDTLRWRLSSDNYDPALPGGYSSHGDWMMGWRPEIMDAWIRGCDQASADCHAHLLGDGRYMY